MDQHELKRSLFRELDEKFIDFKEVPVAFHWNTTSYFVQTELQLPIPVAVSGSKISFSFQTKQGDIAFGISFISDEDGSVESVVDLTRVNSDVEEIAGTFEVPREGTIIFSWDNSFSWFNGKILSYSIELLQEAGVIANDEARIEASRDLLQQIKEDNVKIQQRLVEDTVNIEALDIEIPMLEDELRVLKNKLAEKIKARQVSLDNKLRIEERVQVNKETATGLRLRCLSRECLKKVLEYVSDAPSRPYLVCKYWSVVLHRDIKKKPSSSWTDHAKDRVKAIFSVGHGSAVTAETKEVGPADTYPIHKVDPSPIQNGYDSDLGDGEVDKPLPYKPEEVHSFLISQQTSSDSLESIDTSTSSPATESATASPVRWRQRRVIMRKAELKRELSELVGVVRELGNQVEELRGQRQQLREEYLAWKKEFAYRNGRPATDEDKEHSARPLLEDYQKCCQTLQAVEEDYFRAAREMETKHLELV